MQSHRTRDIVPIGVAFLASVIFAATCGAQTATTSVRGTVTDPSGLPIYSATVVVTEPSSGLRKQLRTDELGRYNLQQIPPGSYAVTAEADGFAEQETHVELLVNQPATLNFDLAVGSAKTVVEVNALSGGVNTVDATTGNPFNSTQVQALPFEGNNLLDLLSLQAGVLFLGDKTTQQQDSDSRSGAVDGARSDQTNFTLDGLDDNDQNKGYAFSGVLRSTRDSVEEFRVVTANANADSGRSSGAQVSLVTRSGTNAMHGSLYEYYRPTNTVANNWFNKQAEFEEGQPNTPPKYLRSTFGASAGGPIKKDRAFYFGAYEGQRTAESQQVTQEVPTASFRNGELTYVTADGSPFTLNPQQIAAMDPNCSGNLSCPLGPGVDPAVEAYYAQLPLANSSTPSDGYNLAGYTFASPAPQNLNTWIGKLDYTLHDNHRFSVRANLQQDRQSGTAQFPGQPASYTLSDDSKGIAAADVWNISSNLVSNLRYGLIHQAYANDGVTNHNYVTFQNISPLQAVGNTSQIVSVLTHNLVDDMTWVKGRHSFQAGANYRLVSNDRQSNATLYSSASVTYLYLEVGAIANTSVAGQPPASLDPAGFGFPAVSPNFTSAYNTAIGDITGLVTYANVYYNNIYANGTLTALPAGQWVKRRYLTNELEYYFQDSWKASSKLNFVFGVRHSFLQVPYERNGQEIAPTVNLNKWFRARWDAANAGQVLQPAFGFAQAGRANGKPGLWTMDKLDLAPRLAVAYALDPQTTIRVGAGVYFDHFGQGIIDSFDQEGAFGLTTADRSPYAQFVDTTPRYSNATTVPTSIVPPVNVTGSTPVTPAGNLILGWGLDPSLKTPYSYVLNTSVQHQFGKSTVVEAAYSGRLGRRLTQMRDLATPNDLVDANSGVDYFAAATQLSKLADAGATVASVQPIAYWEDMFPWLASAGVSATQAAYQQFAPFRGNEAAALIVLDTVPGASTPNNELYRYYDPQYSSLYAWSSIGTSSYHGLQLSLHHPPAHGLQFDAYYTLSKSIDLGSDAERSGPSAQNISGAGGYFSQVINAFHPKGNRGVSDFDVHHVLTGNAIAELPFGRGRWLGSGLNRVGDALVAHWTMTGLTHWTSGLPFSSFDGLGWGTDWADQSWNVATSPIASGGHHHDSGGQPNAFKNQSTALSSLRPPYPGETGERNFYRGDGYFSIDSGVAKVFPLFEGQQLKLTWECFNTLNSVRFDPASISNNPFGNPESYGRYAALLTQGRRMQFSLRYAF